MRPRWLRRRRGLAAALVVAAVAVGSVACGSPRYHYVKSSSERTYVKVPRAWALFDEDQIAATFNEYREAKALYNRLNW